METVNDKELNRWRRYRKQSRSAVPVYLTIFVVLALILWWAQARLWLACLLLGIQGAYTAMEAYNVVYLGRKIREAEAAGDSRVTNG